MIFILFFAFFIIGLVAAKVSDELIIKPNMNSNRMLEGENLIKILNRSREYELIRHNQEIHRSRSNNRNIPGGDSVGKLRDGGDGFTILQLPKGE